MKKVQLELWSTFDKLCLISTMCKLKQTLGDQQNWVAISRHTRQLHDTIGSFIDMDKRSDDWFSVRQCAAQYDHLMKATGPRKKKRTERSDSDNLESLEASLRLDLKSEMQKSLAETQAEYLRTKKVIDDLDHDLIDDDHLEELMFESGDFVKECEELRGIDIKSKLKSMLDEKNADNENSNKMSIIHLSSTSSESAALPPPPPPPPVPETKASSTASPLLTSLLQSPSPLVRSTLPSTSSPTISLLLHSSPPVPITDSTLSKLLETPPNVPVPSTSSSVSTALSLPSTSAQPSTREPVLKNVLEDSTIIIEKLPNEKIDDGSIIVEDLTDIEHGVIGSEIIIEQDSSPSKKRRIDLGLEVVEIETEDVITEENGGVVEETVEEIIERVEEAIIQTVGETNLSDLDQELSLDQTDTPITIDSSDIGQLEIGQDQTVEVILLPPNMNPDTSTILDNNAITTIISGSPVKINNDTVVIDDSAVKISDTVVIDESPIKITPDTVVIDDSSGKITDDAVVISNASINISNDTVIIDNSPIQISNKTLVLKETPLEIAGDTVIIGTKNANQAVVLASSSSGEDVILDENAMKIAGGTVIIGEEKMNSNTLVLQEAPIEINCDTIVVDEDTLKDIQISPSETPQDTEDVENNSLHGSPDKSNSSEEFDELNSDGPPTNIRTYSGRSRITELTVQAVTSFEIRPDLASEDSTKSNNGDQDIIENSDNVEELGESISSQNRRNNDNDVKAALATNSNINIIFEESNRKGSSSSSDNQNSREYHEYDSITESEIGSETDKAPPEGVSVVNMDEFSDDDMVFCESPKEDNDNKEDENSSNSNNLSLPVSKDLDIPDDHKDSNRSESDSKLSKLCSKITDSLDKKEPDVSKKKIYAEDKEYLDSIKIEPLKTDDSVKKKQLIDNEQNELSNPALSSDENKGTYTDGKNNSSKLVSDNIKNTSAKNKEQKNSTPVDILDDSCTQPEKVESKDSPVAQSSSSSSSESEEEEPRSTPRLVATELLKDEQLKKIFGQCFVSVSPVSFEKLKSSSGDRSLSSPTAKENNKPKPRGRTPGKTKIKPGINKTPEVKKPKPLRGPRPKRSTLNSSIDSKPESPSMSITSSDDDRDLRAWKKSIMLVYSRLASHKFASVFMKPITENEAPGYHDVILRPMDLSRIKKNIENGIVRTTVEFQRDMLLMVQNAIMYNKIDTPYYEMALEMGKDMVAEMEIMVQALGDGVPLLNFSNDDKSKSRGRLTKSSVEDLSKKRKNTFVDEGRLAKRKRTMSS